MTMKSRLIVWALRWRTNMNLDELFERELELNHTYEINIKLNNCSPEQLKMIDKVLESLEQNEVKVSKFEVMND